MGARSSRSQLEEHLLWIEEARAQDEETVSSFRRMVPPTSRWYQGVLRLFDWQRWSWAEGPTDPDAVSDLLGEMRLAIASVQVNRVDVF